MSRKTTKPNCLNCGKEVNRRPKIYCNNKCQRDFEYKKFIALWLKDKTNGTISKTKAISHNVKRWLKETRGEKCEKCGWSVKHSITGNIPIEVNHIDGDADNTTPSNLELLCPNCHSLTPNFRNLNKNSKRILRRSNSVIE